jgi:UDP-3-O-[3-hydroxymyristoyl] glucosamine N-acyltransferase
MPDPRFYEDLGPVSLAEPARLTGAELSRADAAERLVARVAVISQADQDSVTYTDAKLVGELAGRSAAVFVHPKQADLIPETCVGLVTGNPAVAYAAAAERLHRSRGFPPGGPAVDPSASLEDDVELGPNVIVGAGATIGRGTRVGPGVVIGPGVAIGRGCTIGPNAVITHALVGDRV